MIRKAMSEDIPFIMEFIDDYWKKNHILSRDTELFDFQYVWGDEVCFIISLDNQSKLNGVLGYIPYDKDDRYIALALWKALTVDDDPMLGIRLLEFIMEDKGTKEIVVPGININTFRIYKYFKFETGKMQHWYRLSRRDKYMIADINEFNIPPVKYKYHVTVQKLDTFREAVTFGIENLLESENRPYKSMGYLKRRYFGHPSYKYLSYGIINEESRKKSVLFLRIQEVQSGRVIRFIDNIGDPCQINCCVDFFDGLMMKLNAEYIDLYETGLSSEILLSGGWLNVDGSGNIIPEYFSPFEQRNIDIYYSSTQKDIVLFKGDGDMDRPN